MVRYIIINRRFPHTKSSRNSVVPRIHIVGSSSPFTQRQKGVLWVAIHHVMVITNIVGISSLCSGENQYHGQKFTMQGQEKEKNIEGSSSSCSGDDKYLWIAVHYVMVRTHIVGSSSPRSGNIVGSSSQCKNKKQYCG